MKTNITLSEALDKASPMLKSKMEHSIELIRKAERLSLMYDAEDGFFLAFSGGKDSQALYHIAELSGVRFKAHFSPTTVDPPQLIKFIKRNYPECEFGKVEKNIYDMAVEKQILPTMRVRWCCAEYKEMAGAGKVTLIGIRHAESARRAKRNEVEISNRKFSGDFEQFTEWQAEKIKKKYKNLNQDQFSYDKEQTVRCISGKDSILVSPIIEWDERDVWEFLNKVMEVPHCELYDKGYHRIGCILCPMSSYKQKMKECEDFPYVKAKWIEAIKAIRRGGGYSKTNIFGGASARTTQPTDRTGGGQQRKLLGNGRTSEKQGSNPTNQSLTTETSTEMRVNGGGYQFKDNSQWIQPESGAARIPSSVFRNNGWKTNRIGGGQEVRLRENRGIWRNGGLPLTTPIPDEELENQIAENIFNWWCSGVSYEQWYAEKFLQQKIDFDD